MYLITQGVDIIHHPKISSVVFHLSLNPTISRAKEIAFDRDFSTSFTCFIYMLSRRSFALCLASSDTLGFLRVLQIWLVDLLKDMSIDDAYAFRPPATFPGFLSSLSPVLGTVRRISQTELLNGESHHSPSPPLNSLSRTALECSFASLLVLGLFKLALWPPAI